MDVTGRALFNELGGILAERRPPEAVLQEVDGGGYARVTGSR